MTKRITSVGDNLTFEDDVQSTKRELDELTKGNFSAHDTRHEEAGADEVTPADHAARHETGGADIVVPDVHASRHEESGVDEIDITGLVGHQFGKNLLLNPSFESYNIDTNSPDFWTPVLTPTLAIVADTLFPARGGNKITITGTGAGLEGIKITGGVNNPLKVLPSTIYDFSFDFITTAGNINLKIYSYNGGAQGTLHISQNFSSVTAALGSVIFTTDADANNLEIIITAFADGDSGSIAHPKLEQGATATPYIPSDRDRVTVREEITNSTPDPHIASRHNKHIITAQGDAPTISAPTGTVYDQDTLLFRFEDDGTGRAITWNAIYEAVVALPATTTAGKKLYVGFIYNSADTKYDCVAVVEEA